ncbi:Wzz/FepE/Etk N-terminal domain-containing protein [Amycolatopsis keratiniphila]|uniref:Wzz/FepE/Etk N-terminal domain-containing protein n=1 Tax=Amycolatopsis keratiniphila TaxID=129921 RepID=UPI000907996E|nr:Wzz/FepE/Etk N-terminal domain-containing protein [Amycolatopsis keratiniphila]OLZ56133.1 exopolysaccharide biosynthesis protein [Amycolatopsis keratiniphila subsp. nogabecina]
MTSAEKAKSEPLIDLQRLVVSIRRRRRMWLATALLGLIAGGLVAMLLPSPPTAVAQILVIHPDDSPTDSGTLMRTDVAVLQTTKTAGEALKKLNSTQAPEEFLKDYEGLGLTNNVLQLTVKGKTKDEALARAQAISDAFIAEYIGRNQAAAAAQQKALLDQRNQAQNELTPIEASIVTEEAKGRNANPAQLERLYSRRAELTSKISDYDGRAQEAGIGTPKVAAGTQIVDAPRILPHSLLKTLATDAGIGFALGLLAGLGLAAVTSVVKDRPVLRREISQHLGASVIAQLPKPPRFLRRSRAATRRQRVAATLVRAARQEGGSVSLLDLGACRITAALAVDMARELAEKGPVSLVDDLPKADLRELAGEGPIQVLDRGDVPMAARERRIGVGSVEPGTAWTDLEFLGTETILVVRAGHANTEWLHTVARQLADRRIPIIGVVVVDPDPRDHTDGTLWDGLHTALRGRAGAVPERTAPPVKPVEMFPREKKNGRRHPTPYQRTDDNADQPTKRFKPVSPDNAEAL